MPVDNYAESAPESSRGTPKGRGTFGVPRNQVGALAGHSQKWGVSSGHRHKQCPRGTSGHHVCTGVRGSAPPRPRSMGAGQGHDTPGQGRR